MPTLHFMDYDRINTEAEIVAAFQRCQDAGEQIQLFESLAERNEPPIQGFLYILKNNQLDPILALTIQALGKITNNNIRLGLRASPSLLLDLCNHAKAGKTDLIKWSAATSIELIGFESIELTKYLSEDPKSIAQKSIKSKVQFLENLNRSKFEIKNHGDYENCINFWTYGATNELRIITGFIGYQDCYDYQNNLVAVARAVTARQGIYGIKEINKMLKNLENNGDLNNTCESKLFETCSHVLAGELLKIQDHPDRIFLLINQGYCLQSEDSQIRFEAASRILNRDSNLLVHPFEINSINPKLREVAEAILSCNFSLHLDFYYQELVYEDLEKIVNSLKIAVGLVSRNIVKAYFKRYIRKLSENLNLLSSGLNYVKVSELKEIERQKQIAEEARRREIISRREEKQREHEKIEREIESIKKRVTSKRDKIARLQFFVEKLSPQLIDITICNELSSSASKHVTGKALSNIDISFSSGTIHNRLAIANKLLSDIVFWCDDTTKDTLSCLEKHKKSINLQLNSSASAMTILQKDNQDLGVKVAVRKSNVKNLLLKIFNYPNIASITSTGKGMFNYSKTPSKDILIVLIIHISIVVFFILCILMLLAPVILLYLPSKYLHDASLNRKDNLSISNNNQKIDNLNVQNKNLSNDLAIINQIIQALI